ncbi:hypothetical protein [Streptomyces flaveolus]|uniref:hypothetical protein n=1 Tax=Streptomyces flaveolus TaxID=67297 RepID=UPI00332831EF
MLRQTVGSAPAFTLARIGAEHRALREKAVREFCAQLCAPAVEGPVSPREVAEVAGGRSARSVDESCRLSGGNPLLLRALVEEEQAGGAVVFAGDGLFAGAVAACLARCGPAAVASARAVGRTGRGGE